MPTADVNVHLENSEELIYKLLIKTFSEIVGHTSKIWNRLHSHTPATARNFTFKN